MGSSVAVSGRSTILKMYYCPCGTEFKSLNSLEKHQNKVEKNGGDHFYNLNSASATSTKRKRNENPKPRKSKKFCEDTYFTDGVMPLTPEKQPGKISGPGTDIKPLGMRNSDKST